MSDSKFLTFSLQESLRPYLTLSDLQVNQSLAKFQIGEVAFSVFVAQLHSSGSSRSIQENRVQIHRELIERQRSLSEQGYKIGFLGMFPEGDAFIAWDPRHVLSLNAAKAASIYGRWTLRNIALKNSAGAHKFNSRSLGGELSFAIALPSQGLGHYLANIEHIHQLQSESDIQLWFSNVEGLLSGTVLEGNKQNLEQAIRERYVSNRYSYPRSPKFKFDVLEAYEYSCCICDRQLDLIQAAHIIPHSHENSVDEVRNGLALCVEHHLLYDDALLLPGPDYDLVFNQERAKDVDSEFQVDRNINLRRSISNLDFQSEWNTELDYVLSLAEEAEKEVSYKTTSSTPISRKESGSYYTPTDVANFFWQEFFHLKGVESAGVAADLWRSSSFIEPAAGAGALVFSLLRQGGILGLNLEQLANIDLSVVDINQSALDFIERQLARLESRWGVRFNRVKLVCTDFFDFSVESLEGDPVFFGNPPFVKNPKGSRWTNLFADFVERSLRSIGANGSCHFILPLSIAFSRRYRHLRDQIRFSRRRVVLSNFDNIPDTLFTNGKPDHTNTNKANSQRCTILSILPSSDLEIHSTRLHRWRGNERRALLTSHPHYHEVTHYTFDNQFPRPENSEILRYLENGPYSNVEIFKSLTCEQGPFHLQVTTVARNFVGIRENATTGVHEFRFNTEEEFLFALLVLSSDLFLDYWRTVGDGFHLTRTNIDEFPLSEELKCMVQNEIMLGKEMWCNRLEFSKQKSHPGGITTSYDFTERALKIIKRFD